MQTVKDFAKQVSPWYGFKLRRSLDRARARRSRLLDRLGRIESVLLTLLARAPEHCYGSVSEAIDRAELLRMEAEGFDHTARYASLRMCRETLKNANRHTRGMEAVADRLWAFVNAFGIDSDSLILSGEESVHAGYGRFYFDSVCVCGEVFRDVSGYCLEDRFYWDDPTGLAEKLSSMGATLQDLSDAVTVWSLFYPSSDRLKSLLADWD